MVGRNSPEAMPRFKTFDTSRRARTTTSLKWNRASSGNRPSSAWISRAMRTISGRLTSSHMHRMKSSSASPPHAPGEDPQRLPRRALEGGEARLGLGQRGDALAAEHLTEQLVLRIEVEIQRALGDPRLPSHRVERGVGEPVLAEDFERRGANLLGPFLGPAAPPGAAFGLVFGLVRCCRHPDRSWSLITDGSVRYIGRRRRQPGGFRPLSPGEASCLKPNRLICLLNLTGATPDVGCLPQLRRLR